MITKDLFAIHIDNNGKKIVQVHKRDKAFTNVGAVNSLNNNDADAISMDMIYNLKEKSYDMYVVLESEGRNVLV